VLEDEAADFALAAAGVPREERGAVHDDRDTRAAFLRVLRVRQHVEEEKELAVADSRKPWGKASRCSPLVLGAHGVLVALPVLAVRGIRDQVVEVASGVPVVRQRAAVCDVVCVAAGRVLHEEIGLRNSPRLGVHLLAEEVDLRPRVEG